MYKTSNHKCNTARNLNNYDLRKSWKTLKEIVGKNFKNYKNGKFEKLSNEYNVNGTIIQDSLKNLQHFQQRFH